MELQKPKHVYRTFIRTTPELLWQAITDPEMTVKYFYHSRVVSDWKSLVAYLEKQRAELEQKLIEVRNIQEKAAVTENDLRQLLYQFGIHIANRDLPEIKKFIGSYVEKVPVVDLQYGGEESRTPVLPIRLQLAA